MLAVSSFFLLAFSSVGACSLGKVSENVGRSTHQATYRKGKAPESGPARTGWEQFPNLTLRHTDFLKTKYPECFVSAGTWGRGQPTG